MFGQFAFDVLLTRRHHVCRVQRTSIPPRGHAAPAPEGSEPKAFDDGEMGEIEQATVATREQMGADDPEGEEAGDRFHRKGAAGPTAL
jgi:hypothetical protein